MKRFLGALSIGLLVLPTACGSSTDDGDGSASGGGAPLAGSGGAAGLSAGGSAQAGSTSGGSPGGASLGGYAGVRGTGAPILGAGAAGVPTWGGSTQIGAAGSTATGGTTGSGGRSTGSAAFSFGGGMTQLPSAKHDCSKVNRYMPCVLNDTCISQEPNPYGVPGICSGVCQNNGWTIYCSYL